MGLLAREFYTLLSSKKKKKILLIWSLFPGLSLNGMLNQLRVTEKNCIRYVGRTNTKENFGLYT